MQFANVAEQTDEKGLEEDGKQKHANRSRWRPIYSEYQREESENTLSRLEAERVDGRVMVLEAVLDGE